MVTEQIATLSYTVDGDLKPIEQKFRQLERRWDGLSKKLSGKPLQLRVAMDDRSVDQAISRLHQKLERGIKPIKIRIDTGDLEQQLGRFQQRMGTPPTASGVGGVIQHRNALGQFIGQAPAIGAGIASLAGAFSGRLAGDRFAGTFGPSSSAAAPPPQLFRGRSYTPQEKAQLIARAALMPARIGAQAVMGAGRVAIGVARGVGYAAGGIYHLLHHDPAPPPTLEENIAAMRQGFEQLGRRSSQLPGHLANLRANVESIQAAVAGGALGGGGGGGGSTGIGAINVSVPGMEQMGDQLAGFGRSSVRLQRNMLRYQRVIARKLYAGGPRGGRYFGRGGGGGRGGRVGPADAERMLEYADRGEFDVHDPLVGRINIEEDLARTQPGPTAAAALTGGEVAGGPLFPDVGEDEDFGRGRLAKRNRTFRRARGKARRDVSAGT